MASPLEDACFEAQDRLVSPTSFVLDSVQKSFRNSPTTCRWPGIHTLDLGVILEHRNTAAAHREAVQPRQEEALVRLEQLGNRQPVPLMALIRGPEHVVQFADQVMHFGRCLDRSFDRDAHGASAKVNVRLSLAPSSDKVWFATEAASRGDEVMADQQVVTIRGSNLGSSILEEAVIDGFKATLQAPLFRPGEAGYDDARKIWNGMIDRRPALIALTPSGCGRWIRSARRSFTTSAN
jgi:hypothetical protein